MGTKDMVNFPSSTISCMMVSQLAARESQTNNSAYLSPAAEALLAGNADRNAMAEVVKQAQRRAKKLQGLKVAAPRVKDVPTYDYACRCNEECYLEDDGTTGGPPDCNGDGTDTYCSNHPWDDNSMTNGDCFATAD